jgi:segregation and condensation protein A
MDIYDIPISLITGQYLEYIGLMKDLSLEIAGEFLVMAATLIQIKSRMLLPPDEAAEDEEMEDPRLELVQRLLEYQAYKDASVILREREESAHQIFWRDREEEEGEEEEPNEPYLFDVNIFDLLTAFKKILDAAPPEVVKITRQTLTVKDRMLHIAELLEQTESVRFEELFAGGVSRTQLIVTFLALLELLRVGLARVYQEQQFGHIWVINPRKAEAEAGAAETGAAGA